MEKRLLIMVGMFRFYFCDFQHGSHNHLWLWNPFSSAGKESACNAGHPSSIPGFRKIPWRRNWLPTPVFFDFPGGSAGKESTCNVGDLGSIPGLGRSAGEGKGCLPTPVFWPGEFHGLDSQRSHKESDMAEQLSLWSLRMWLVRSGTCCKCLVHSIQCDYTHWIANI